MILCRRSVLRVPLRLAWLTEMLARAPDAVSKLLVRLWTSWDPAPRLVVTAVWLELVTCTLTSTFRVYCGCRGAERTS